MAKYIISLLAILLFVTHAHAELDSANQEALQKTKELLVNPAQRKEAIKNDEKAQKADAHAKALGGKNTDEIYALSSKVFEKLVIKYNGDTDKIQEVLTKAMKDPASFANSEFSPEDLKALRELAGKLPAPISNK